MARLALRLTLRLVLRIALITLPSGSSQYSSEILAAPPSSRRGRKAGAGVCAGASAGMPIVAISRHYIEAAVPNLALAAHCSALQRLAEHSIVLQLTRKCITDVFHHFNFPY